jgi:hypothetical protein
LGLLSGIAQPAPGQEPRATTAVEPQALEALRRATDYLEGLPRFRVHARVFTDVVQEDGEKLQFESVTDVAVRRPDRLRAVRVRDDGERRELRYDGVVVTLFDPALNVYGRVPVSGPVDDALDRLEEATGTPTPLADLLYNDLSFLFERPTSGAYVGPSTIRGRPTHHLAFRNDALDWQLWVDAEDPPVLRKVVLVYKTLPGAPTQVAELDGWEVPDAIADGEFRFEPPPGSCEIPVRTRRPQEGGNR